MQDIIDNVQAIQRYVTGMDLASFEEDARTNDAVERCLERISEAAAKLGDIAPTIMPGQPWQQIRGLGNRLRHEYDAIRADRLWDIVRIDLPALSSACEHALRQLREQQPE
ncbi:MAG TPA: HepT-like ribonuclease domain-containing protein [Bryobacteraceae bacterium]